MLTNKVRQLFEKLGLKKESRSKSRPRRRNNRRRGAKVPELPDNVLSLIFDYSSPFDVSKWRTVNRQFNRVAEEKEKTRLYMDVLRLDITDILPEGVETDGDFYKHPKHNIIIHSEKRSVLLAAHSHWSPKEAEVLLRAMRYYGRYCRTVSMDASVTELLVASQCTSDLQHWFQFQTACGSIEIPPIITGEMPLSRSILPRKYQRSPPEPRWNPKTQRIPTGPFFPNVIEIAFRASHPQLRRLRRLNVYCLKPTCIFNPDNAQLVRLVIIAGKKSAPINLKLKNFLEWVNAESLGEKYCTQFI